MSNDRANLPTPRRRTISAACACAVAAALTLFSLPLASCGGAGERPASTSNQSSPASNQSSNAAVPALTVREASSQQETFTFENKSLSVDEFVRTGARCATPDVLPVRVAQIQRRVERFRRSGRSTKRDSAAPPIQVHFHVINKGPDPAADGNLTDQQIASQIQVLNNAYAGTHFRFELANVTRTTNAAWYEMGIGSEEELAAKQALGVRRKDVLNIYSARLAGDLLGWAVFPWEFSLNPYDDGVVIRFSTLPGGASAPYDEGDTLVHEAAHWLGVFHTFQGGCADPGDAVADTPAEALAAFDCVDRDTCPTAAGNDPIHNFMDYTDDSCMNSFTAGQSARMDEMFAVYRRP